MRLGIGVSRPTQASSLWCLLLTSLTLSHIHCAWAVKLMAAQCAIHQMAQIAFGVIDLFKALRSLKFVNSFHRSCTDRLDMDFRPRPERQTAVYAV